MKTAYQQVEVGSLVRGYKEESATGIVVAKGDRKISVLWLNENGLQTYTSNQWERKVNGIVAVIITGKSGKLAIVEDTASKRKMNYNDCTIAEMFYVLQAQGEISEESKLEDWKDKREQLIKMLPEYDKD